MGEDRLFLGIVAKSKRGRRAVAELLAMGYRSRTAARLARGEVGTDLVLYHFLVERSGNLMAEVKECGDGLVAEVAGRWFGKLHFAAGDYVDALGEASRALGGADLVVVDITRAAYEAFRRYLKCIGAEAELAEPLPPPGRPVEERYCKRYGLYCGEMRNYVKIYGVYRAGRGLEEYVYA